MPPANSVLVLKDKAPFPTGTHPPPRQPKWTDTFAYIANPDQFCRTNLAQHGPVFKTSVFGGTTVFVGSAAANQMVFNGDDQYTEIALPATTMSMFGEYSLFQRPDLHRQRKTAIRPGLSGQILDSYTPRMNQVIQRHLQSWSVPGLLPLFPTVEAICFEVLVPLLLGVDLSQPDGLADLPIDSQAKLKALYKTFFDGFYSLLPWNSPLTGYGRGLQARAKLIEFMRAVVQQRQQTPIDPTSDFLAMMLASQQADPDSVFSDALIENQCLLQLWASHYEVSGVVSSLLYQLGQHPQLVERLRQEQTQVMGQFAGQSSARATEPVSPEHLKQMAVLEATIKETLRVLPPTSTANRRLTKSVVVDGVRYEKGWGLIAEPRITHAMDAYFPDPDRFNPDRFLTDRPGKQYEFIPFGGGIHACLGVQMAMVMTKIFASHILRQFDWQLQGEARFVQFPLKRIRDNYRIEVSRRAA